LESKSTAVVTGGASGIGEAIALAFLERNDAVIVLDRAKPNSHRLNAPDVLWLETDVGDERSVEAAFAAVEEQFDRLDVLVNCAGIDARAELVDTTASVWNEIMRVNLTGTFLCTRSAAKMMVRSRSGVVVCISSVNALLGWKRCSAYSASKGGIDAFVRAAAADLGEYGIRVVSVAPGSIETPIWADELTPEVREMMSSRTALGYVGLPEDVAGVVTFLASSEARYLTGVVVPVCGGRATIDFLPRAL
jgi:NAD(P)-dependent dehydrogenase (short-subunit alcohol dehydrogenase family)